MQYARPVVPTLLSLIALTFGLALTACGGPVDSDPPVVVDPGGSNSTGGGADAGDPSDPDGGATGGGDTGTTPCPDADPAPDTGSPTGGADTGGPQTSPDTGTSGGSGADTGSDDPENCYGSRRMCDGTCTELLSNPDHCGSCDLSCGDGQACVNGICECAAGQIRCNGACVDPTSNDDHCFQCGNACGAGMMCQRSVCVERDKPAAVLKYTNQARQTPTDCGQYGTKPAGPTLTLNPELTKAAQDYAERMAKHGFMAHTDPLDGSSFVQRVGRTNYTGYAIGENLARGVRQTAKIVVDGWIKSDGHCRNLANPDATEIGIGFAPSNGRFDGYWVQLFGR